VADDARDLTKGVAMLLSLTEGKDDNDDEEK
jgi:hypothetical protein